MIPPPPDNPNAEFPDIPQSAGSIILSGLLDLPNPGDHFDPYRPLFASLLLAHLVRNSEHAKKIARETTLPSGDGDSAIQDEDDRVSLVQVIVGNLMMAAREHTECVNRAAKEGKMAGSTEEDDWTRVMVGYLVLLCTWLWDSPKTVKEFLSESANLQVVSDWVLLEMRTMLMLCSAYTTNHSSHRYRPARSGLVSLPPGCLLRV